MVAEGLLPPPVKDGVSHGAGPRKARAFLYERPGSRISAWIVHMRLQNPLSRG